MEADKWRITVEYSHLSRRGYTVEAIHTGRYSGHSLDIVKAAIVMELYERYDLTSEPTFKKIAPCNCTRTRWMGNE